MIVIKNVSDAQIRTPVMASFLGLSCITNIIPNGMGRRKKNIHAARNLPILINVSMVIEV